MTKKTYNLLKSKKGRDWYRCYVNINDTEDGL